MYGETSSRAAPPHADDILRCLWSRHVRQFSFYLQPMSRVTPLLTRWTQLWGKDSKKNGTIAPVVHIYCSDGTIFLRKSAQKHSATPADPR